MRHLADLVLIVFFVAVGGVCPSVSPQASATPANRSRVREIFIVLCSLARLMRDPVSFFAC
jgi:hypothetical protein